MADYYPLIARAVAGLDRNTGENRRALYERARSALVNQLRGVDSPLDESDITRERLALEDAIRRLEADATRRAQPDMTQGVEPEESRPTLRDQGLRDFRDTVTEAQGLGGASAEASRVARAAYDDVHGVDAPSDHAQADAHDHPHDRTQAQDSEREVESHYFEPPADEGIDAGPHDDRPHEYESVPASHHEADEHDGAPDMPAELPEPAAKTGWRPPRAAAAHATEEEDDYSRPVRSYGGIVRIVVLLVAMAGIAGAGYWQRDALVSAVKTTFASLKSAPPAPAPKPAAPSEPAGRPKIADRIGTGDNAPSAPATAPAAAVAQKVVLYDEDSSDPKGKRYVGSAVWRTETVSPGPGLAPELAIRADIEIPERRLRMTWSLRRNTDKALPASHTIEIMFTLPADFAEGGINNVPGVLMKQNEEARGVPLAGLAVKVTNGYFLIGLSAVGVDLQRNVQLLKERDWFDIPVVYTSGKRAILAMEKGTPGGRAFEEAFRAWGQ